MQADDVGVVFEVCAGCAFAVHIAAGGAGSVVAGVVDVDVAVSGIEDVVFADMVFRAEREPDAVAVGQAVHAVAGVFDGRAVKGDACAQLQRVGHLVRTAERDFVSVAPVGGDDGAVGFAVDDVFGVFKNQFRFVKAAVARPSHIAEQVEFVGGFVHAVNGQGFGRDDFDTCFFMRNVTAGGKRAQIPCAAGVCAVGFPFCRAFEGVGYFGAVVHADPCAVVDVPHPSELIAEAPVVAFYFGVSVRFALRADGHGAAGGA